MMTRLLLLLAFLVAVSPGTAQETKDEDEVEADEGTHRMLPLAVGNSWDFSHDFNDGTLQSNDVTISITHTEDIEGHTYHVFSHMPYDEPPVPLFFLAGKKVRWEGNRLLFRQQDRDVALYQFGQDHEYQIISKTTSDTLWVDRNEWDSSDSGNPIFGPQGWPRKAGCLVQNIFISEFTFGDHMTPLDRNRFLEAFGSGFLEDFGMYYSAMIIRDQGDIIAHNLLYSYQAIISGERWEFWLDARKVSAAKEESPCMYETTVKSLAWGVVKQGFIPLIRLGDLK